MRRARPGSANIEANARPSKFPRIGEKALSSGGEPNHSALQPSSANSFSASSSSSGSNSADMDTSSDEPTGEAKKTEKSKKSVTFSPRIDESPNASRDSSASSSSSSSSSRGSSTAMDTSPDGSSDDVAMDASISPPAMSSTASTLCVLRPQPQPQSQLQQKELVIMEKTNLETVLLVRPEPKEIDDYYRLARAIHRSKPKEGDPEFKIKSCKGIDAKNRPFEHIKVYATYALMCHIMNKLEFFKAPPKEIAAYSKQLETVETTCKQLKIIVSSKSSAFRSIEQSNASNSNAKPRAERPRTPPRIFNAMASSSSSSSAANPNLMTAGSVSPSSPPPPARERAPNIPPPPTGFPRPTRQLKF